MTMPVLPPVPPRMGVLPAGPPLAAPALPPLPPMQSPPAVAVDPGVAAAEPPGAAAPVPPMLQPPAVPPPPPLPPPPTVHAGTDLKERPKAENITNPFERQATMILDTAEDWAKQMAQNLGEHPTEAVEETPEVIHEMFHFSPYGTDAPAVFWQKHEELLQMALQAHDPNPHAVAERGALDEVYPYRAEMALLDSLGPEERVARAERLVKISHGEAAKGNVPTALPTIVGPAGLPEGEAEE